MGESSEKERDLFLDALEIESSSERDVFLDRACDGNAELLQRVTELLRLHEGAGEFLNGKKTSEAALIEKSEPQTRVIKPDSEELGTVIGRYKLL